MKTNVKPDPVNVSMFCADAVAVQAHVLTDFSQKLTFRHPGLRVLYMLFIYTVYFYKIKKSGTLYIYSCSFCQRVVR